MEAELIKSTETALAAFNEYKGLVDGLKTKLGSFESMMDAFDATKLDNLAKDIGSAIEHSQKANATQEAQTIKLAEMEKAHEKMLAVLSRPGSSTESVESKAKELTRKRKKLFNEFARISEEANKVSFESYLKQNVTDELELKAMSVNSDPNGGYTVLPEFGGIIQTRIYESSPIRQLASVIEVGKTDTYEVVVDNDQAGFAWVGETQARTETTTPTLGKIDIPVNEMSAKPKVTQKMLDDSSIDVESWLGGKVADVFARGEATSFVSGNGVLKPKGLLSYAAGTDITQQQVAQIGSGTSGAFTYNGLVSLQSSLKEPYQNNAGFLIQRASNYGIMTIVDGQQRPIFNLSYDKNTGLEPMILGKPVRFAADMPSIGANALAAIYGDIRKAYQIVDRMGIRVLRDPYSEKPYIQFYTTRRVGGAVVNFEAYVIQKLV